VEQFLVELYDAIEYGHEQYAYANEYGHEYADANANAHAYDDANVYDNADEYYENDE